MPSGDKSTPLTTLHILGGNHHDRPPLMIIWQHGMVGLSNGREFLMLYNSAFSLPTQESWNSFCLSSTASMKVISILRMKAFAMDEWPCLPKLRKHIGKIGRSLSSLLEWTLIYRDSPLLSKSDCSLGVHHVSAMEMLANNTKSLQLRQYLQCSQPLIRQSPWPLG